MFAIVDIETTGGSAESSGITEVAIVLHSGTAVEGRYHTLVNPGVSIPRYITALTGITDKMVAYAPFFETVAEPIFNLLKDRIFVAHNVNFDYSFLKHHLQACGYMLNARKLCTVRYARKVIPDLPSYSLGRLTAAVGIAIQNRHRAAGDVSATSELFDLLLSRDKNQAILSDMLRGRNADQYLPMQVSRQKLESIPYGPGVYYFHDKGGKVIYVGKAVNLSYRVRSHFSNNAASQRKQDLLRMVADLSWQTCPTELMATVLESIEIKRLWPAFNRSQKRFEPQYGLYSYCDRAGLLHLTVEKRRKHLPALHTFGRVHEGFALARKVAALYQVNEDHLFATRGAATAVDAEQHNAAIHMVTEHIKNYLPSFAVLEQGTDEWGSNQSIAYLVHEGRFAAMGVVDCVPPTAEDLLQQLTPYPENDFIRSLLYNYASRYPQQVVHFSADGTAAHKL